MFLSRHLSRSLICAFFGCMVVLASAGGGPYLASLSKANKIIFKPHVTDAKYRLTLRGGGEDEASPDDTTVPMNQDGKQASHESEPWLKELEDKLRTELGDDDKPLSKNEIKRRLKAARVEREREEKKEKQRAASTAQAG